MKFAYGISDFEKIILNNYFYQDRTHLLPEIETTGYQLVFIRPRRFGKSLLLSMLEHYYDVNRATQFDDLFGKLAIGKSPTPRHNQYLVMKWDFSLVKAHGDLRDIENALHQHINDQISEFSDYYADRLNKDIHIVENNAISSFSSVMTAIRGSGYKLYLLIDEYDNFANEVMMSRQTHYEALLYGEGLLKTIFKAVKAAAGGMGLDRVFITGVSPVVLSDMTSGYNVAKNIYLEPEFNELCGFTEAEIETVLNRMKKEGGSWSVSEALDTMRTFYNGYRFSEDANGSVYNPTLSLYFLAYLQKHQDYPKLMLDENLAMDRNKLIYISQLPHGEDILLKAVSDKDSLIIPQLARRFGVADMLNAVKDQSFMASLLYYFGILTFAGNDVLGRLILKVPNLVAKTLYLERLQELLLPTYEDRVAIEEVAAALYLHGDLQPLCDFLENRYFKVLSNRDYRWSNELLIKIAFMTLLFNDRLYMMVSETETNRKYVDLSLIVRPDMRKYQALDLVLEFKYLSLKDLNMTAQQLQDFNPEQLAALPLVVSKLNEAKIQAEDYAGELSSYYQLKQINAFAVVALGFERVVWHRVVFGEAA